MSGPEPTSFQTLEVWGKIVYFLGVVQLSSLQITEYLFTHVYASTKSPSHILHPHIPLLLKAAPANRQTECAFFQFLAS